MTVRNAADSKHRTLPNPPTTMHRTLSRLDWSIAFAVAILCAGVSLYRMVPGVCGVHHDDGVYVLTAKALASGEGYRLVQLPERPLQTKYPILYPAVLAFVWRAWPRFPDNLVAMQLLSCIAMASAVSVYYLYSARWCVLDRSAAATAATVTATVPLLGYFATLPMSEGLFMLALTVAVWQTERLAASGGEARGRRVACALALTACALLRTAGVVLVIAMLAWVARRRALKPSVVLMSIGPVLGWFAWTASAGAASDVRTAYYTSYSGWLTLLAPDQFASVVGANLRSVLSGIGTVIAQGLWTYLGQPVVISGVVCAALAAVWCAATRGLTAVVLAAYVAQLCVWPWPNPRFLVPVAPLLTTAACGGLLLAAGARYSRSARALLLVSALVAVTGNLLLARDLGRLSRRFGYPYASVDRQPVNWSEYEAVFDWLRRSTPRDAIVASDIDPSVFLYAGRRGFLIAEQNAMKMFYQPEPSLGSAPEVAAALRRGGATYLLRTPLPGWPHYELREQLLMEIRQLFPDALQLVYVGIDPRFEVFKLRRETLPSAPSALQAPFRPSASRSTSPTNGLNAGGIGPPFDGTSLRHAPSEQVRSLEAIFLVLLFK
jgi:hypothetical protein